MCSIHDNDMAGMDVLFRCDMAGMDDLIGCDRACGRDLGQTRFMDGLVAEQFPQPPLEEL